MWVFLDLTLRRNPKLIETAFHLHQKGLIEPDTYVLDLDNIINNAKLIKEEADKYKVKLYFMTKQFGRNPYIAAELMKLGYEGAVTVDFREADILYDNNIKIGNVGHLVQIPSRMIEKMLLRNPEVITVYSVEKAIEVSAAAQKLGRVQNIMLKILGKDDIIYPGQNGGIPLESLKSQVEKIIKLPNIVLYGLTSFPCFAMDNETKSIKKTKNLDTILMAKTMLEKEFKIKLHEINTPSMTCAESIKEIAKCGGTHGEPGHGLLGTTPLHPLKDQIEVPSIVYVSEVSHNMNDMSYCYGGGHYRRSFMNQALVGSSISRMKKVNVEMPSVSNIDYYIGLKENCHTGDTAIFAFRTQVFVTRSKVAVIKGINADTPKIVGIYDSQGRLSGNLL
jgi:predicted amino acid racemase